MGKLEGTQKREHRLLLWGDYIEEMDGLDVNQPGAPADLEFQDTESLCSSDGAQSPSAVELRRQVFKMLDTEGTGVLGREQVRRLVQEIENGTELDDEDLDAAMAAMDDDGNGTVDFEEFSDWWIKRTEEDVEDEEDIEDDEIEDVGS